MKEYKLSEIAGYRIEKEFESIRIKTSEKEVENKIKIKIKNNKLF